MKKLLLSLGCAAALSCGPRTASEDTALNPRTLRVQSLHFVQRSMLEEGAGSTTSSGSSGGYAPTLYESSGFWPATPLVLPARAATFLNENYAAGQGFSYQSFEFAGTGCSASNAFERYFAAIETLGGSSLSSSQKDQIRASFANIFTESENPEIQQAVCLFYDLIACIGDYAVHNQAVLRQAAASGNYEPLFAGAASCVAEVIGVDDHTPTEFVQ